MQVVETLTSFGVSAGNAAIASATMSSQMMNVGLGAFKNSSLGGNPSTPAANVQAPQPPSASAPNGVATQGNADALLDPGLTQARKVLDLATSIGLLVNGGPDGKPDWEKIRGKGAVRLVPVSSGTKGLIIPNRAQAVAST